MNEMQIFNNPEFGEVRTVVIDGEPWFVGNDCANALGYKNLYNGVVKNTDEEDRRVSPVGSASGTQQTVVLNESGLYSLIFGSKLPSAKKFKRWVTAEVLPQLRKTGTYGNRLPQNPMQLLELHYEALKQVNRKVFCLEERMDEFEQGLPLFPSEADSISGEVKKRVVNCLGGKSSNAYRNESIRRRTFIDAYQNLKRNFNVRTYKSIKRSQCDRAIEIVERYQPPVFLSDEIEQCNLQMNLSDYRG